MLNCWTLFSFKTQSFKIKTPEVNKGPLLHHVYIGIYFCIGIKARTNEKCRHCVRLQAHLNLGITSVILFQFIPVLSLPWWRTISKAMASVPSRAPSLSDTSKSMGRDTKLERVQSTGHAMLLCNLGEERRGIWYGWRICSGIQRHLDPGGMNITLELLLLHSKALPATGAAAWNRPHSTCAAHTAQKA